MINPYSEYYVEQAGSGLPGFAGVKYQRGHGFFGRLFSGAILPILKYLGKRALGTGLDVASDALEGQNVKEAALRRMKETGSDVARDAIARGRSYLQSGSGIIRRRKRNRTRSAIKGVKRTKKRAVTKKKRRVRRKKRLSSFLD